MISEISLAGGRMHVSSGFCTLLSLLLLLLVNLPTTVVAAPNWDIKNTPPYPTNYTSSTPPPQPTQNTTSFPPLTLPPILPANASWTITNLQTFFGEDRKDPAPSNIFFTLTDPPYQARYDDYPGGSPSVNCSWAWKGDDIMSDYVQCQDTVVGSVRSFRFAEGAPRNYSSFSLMLRTRNTL
jgi:hypothetical protein